MLYIQVLRAFREVQEACFGKELKPDFEEKIQNPESRQLGISVTPKVGLGLILFWKLTA